MSTTCREIAIFCIEWASQVTDVWVGFVRIAYLEDDADQSDVVATWLADAGWQVDTFDRGQKLVNAVKLERYDMVLLDWGVPDLDGLSVLKWARQNIDTSTPILFLTARDAEEDVVRALEAGADDYVAKPLSPALTLARINALARRSGIIREAQNQRRIGPIAFDKTRELITLDDEPVKMTHREFELAVYLLENVGRLLPRAAILKEIWGLNEQVVTRTLDTHISRIKKKLNLKPAAGWSLRSVYHHGYRLERLDASSEEEE